MSDVQWVLLASVVIWIGLAGYIMVIAKEQQKINRRLDLLEHDDD